MRVLNTDIDTDDHTHLDTDIHAYDTTDVDSNDADHHRNQYLHDNTRHAFQHHGMFGVLRLASTGNAQYDSHHDFDDHTDQWMYATLLPDES